MTLDRWVSLRNEGAAVHCRVFCFPMLRQCGVLSAAAGRHGLEPPNFAERNREVYLMHTMSALREMSTIRRRRRQLSSGDAEADEEVTVKALGISLAANLARVEFDLDPPDGPQLVADQCT